MKKLSILGLFIFALLSFNSCETEDDVVFTTQDPEGFVFTNSTLDTYVLAASTSSNLGERFTWNSADFGVPTNTSYELQSSVSGDFSDASIVATTTGNEIAMTIGQMMTVAMEAGLDNDPDSPEPNTGSFSVRLKAFAGDTGGSSDSFSNALTLNVELLEITDNGGGTGISEASWGIIGSGYNNWGDGGPDGTFYTTDQTDVFVTYATLIDGEIKFRENNEWVNDFGDDGADGTLETGGANIAVNAGTYKITLDVGAGTYTLEPFSWGVVGSGYNDWGNDGPDGKFYYDYTTDTFKAGLRLVDGEIKFRQNNEWVTDFGDSGADGTLDGGGDNIAVTAGHYLITLDFNSGMYTIESQDVWGVVGSGYNDWGNEGPDFALTQVQPGVYYGDVATMVDGEVKFRANNEWTMDFGDSGADGTIDAGGDNIAVSAGLYRVRLNTNEGTYALNQIQ
ncbi:SusE domain-containing protein [Winogradskyella ursingii]|uniref:SusE domain-containing protein n=1 Tax=Winogradskyella ursingii TaxID=2686079 RepID=UPI0015CB0CF0|nr:SusE domain-containing protein [Winogradskyella ursingii]